MLRVSKYWISLEIISTYKSSFMHALHIIPGTNKAHMRCVGQTDPQILRSKSQVQYLKLKLKMPRCDSNKSTFTYLWFSLYHINTGNVSNIMSMIVRKILIRCSGNWGHILTQFVLFLWKNAIFHHFSTKKSN